MTDYCQLIQSKGTPEQKLSLKSYLSQIEIQKEKKKNDLEKYQRKTNAVLVNKEKKLTYYEGRMKRFEDYYLQRSDFPTEAEYNEYASNEELRRPYLRLSTASRPLVECISLAQEDVTNYKELREKEFQRREEHYDNLIKRYMIKIESLAKKIK